MTGLFDLSLTLDLLDYDFVRNMLIAGAVLGLVAGVLSPLIVARNMAFAVHGTSELAFTGGAAALLLGISVGYGALAGSIVAALLLALLSRRKSDRDAVIGAILAFGLGVGVLLLYLYEGRAANKFGLLTGQIVSANSTDLLLLVGTSIAVLAVLAVIYRPLYFASVDADLAVAKGVPIQGLSVLFAVLVGIATALSVQVVGALLVLALMITPAAAAGRIAKSPFQAVVLSVLFAETAALGGIVLSLAPGVPVSAFVTAISFTIFVICWAIGRIRPINRSLATS